MSIIVQKYGGSSVENKEKLEIICQKIIKEKNNNNDIVVVVSAQGKTTNNLIQKAKDYTSDENKIDKKDLDFLLSTGEMQTASLLSIMLNSKGYDSICLTGQQAGIITDSNFGNAKILDVLKENILVHLNQSKIVIVTGFQGNDKLGNITTLGRGGSDLSAVAIACALEAAKCEIFSDIDGIFSADPNVISNSKLLSEISYDEMLELAHMEPLCAKNIFESIIMFILDDASLNDMLNIESEDYDPDELCNYAREILCSLNLPEVEDFISELPEVDDAW